MLRSEDRVLGVRLTSTTPKVGGLEERTETPGQDSMSGAGESSCTQKVPPGTLCQGASTYKRTYWSLGQVAAGRANGTTADPHPRVMPLCGPTRSHPGLSVSLQGLPHLLVGAMCRSNTCLRGTLGACLTGVEPNTYTPHIQTGPLGLSAPAGQG